jgi:hypothetical protein
MINNIKTIVYHHTLGTIKTSIVPLNIFYLSHTKLQQLELSVYILLMGVIPHLTINPLLGFIADLKDQLVKDMHQS